MWRASRVMAGGSPFPKRSERRVQQPGGHGVYRQADRPVDGQLRRYRLKYNGDAYDYQGNPHGPAATQDGRAPPELGTNDGGQAGFGA